MLSHKMQNSIKALLLIGLGLFLFSRIANGTLTFYINQRFVGLTLLAVLGLIIVGASYRFGDGQSESAKDDEESLEHSHDHEHHHAHDHEHHHHDHHHHDHDHSLSWSGVILVSLPILLGLLVTPNPLGASAVSNREVSIGTSKMSSMPAAIQRSVEKPTTQKNILDWLQTFQASPDPATEFAGQEARVVGFVYEDETLTDADFWVTRYTLSCCVADAAVIALGVRLPDDGPALQTDQWVEVSGVFVPGEYEGVTLPVLEATSVIPISAPNQPYLYQ